MGAEANRCGPGRRVAACVCVYGRRGRGDVLGWGAGRVRCRARRWCGGESSRRGQRDRAARRSGDCRAFPRDSARRPYRTVRAHGCAERPERLRPAEVGIHGAGHAGQQGKSQRRGRHPQPRHRRPAGRPTQRTRAAARERGPSSDQGDGREPAEAQRRDRRPRAGRGVLAMPGQDELAALGRSRRREAGGAGRQPRRRRRGTGRCARVSSGRFGRSRRPWRRRIGRRVRRGAARRLRRCLGRIGVRGRSVRGRGIRRARNRSGVPVGRRPAVGSRCAIRWCRAGRVSGAPDVVPGEERAAREG